MEPFRGILYVFDSLRPDFMGCYNHDEDSTPEIDRVAQDGIICENAYSQAIWTAPSAASILTGLYPDTHKIYQFNHDLGNSHPFVTDRINNLEIPSAGFSTTLLVSPERGFDRGFDEFYALGGEGEGLRPDIMEKLNDYLIPWIEANAEDGFFILVWAMGPHHPYLTPETADDPSKPMLNVEDTNWTQEHMRKLPKTSAAEIKSQYRSAISYSDSNLGKLIDALQSQGIYEDTNIIVTSDHGEIFDEHARMEYVSNYIQKPIKRVLGEDKIRYLSLFERSGFVGHQGIYPYEELVNVPLILKPASDKKSPEIRRWSGLIETIDILPTVLDLADLNERKTQGNSIFEYIQDDASRDYVFTSSRLHSGNITYRSIQNTEFKFCQRFIDNIWDSINHDRGPQSIISYLLGDNKILINLDNQERISNKGIESKLQSKLQKHIAHCNEQSNRFQQNIHTPSEETREQLKHLGYQ